MPSMGGSGRSGGDDPSGGASRDGGGYGMDGGSDSNNGSNSSNVATGYFGNAIPSAHALQSGFLSNPMGGATSSNLTPEAKQDMERAQAQIDASRDALKSAALNSTGTQIAGMPEHMRSRLADYATMGDLDSLRAAGIDVSPMETAGFGSRGGLMGEIMDLFSPEEHPSTVNTPGRNFTKAFESGLVEVDKDGNVTPTTKGIVQNYAHMLASMLPGIGGLMGGLPGALTSLTGTAAKAAGYGPTGLMNDLYAMERGGVQVDPVEPTVKAGGDYRVKPLGLLG